MKPEIVSEEPVTIAELKEELTHIKERDGELNFRASKTEDYLNHFAKFDSKKAQEFKKKIEDLNIPRLKPEHIVKIIDVMPKAVDDIKLILQGDPITISQDNMKKIVAVVEEYS